MIRDERRSDIPAIRCVTELAFSKVPYASGDEQDVVDRLRKAKALYYSIVAVEEDRVLGHIAFSPVTLNSVNANWFALGPVSVSPERQGKGIGSKLINAGIERLEASGARGCILTGNPGYYHRFGFSPAPEHCPACEPAEYFMMNQFDSDPVAGHFAFHRAFYGAV